jgi:hypothetical protein
MNDSLAALLCNDHGTWQPSVTNSTVNGTCICSTYYVGESCASLTLAPFTAAHWVLIGLWTPLLITAIWYTSHILYGIIIGKQQTLYSQLWILVCSVLCAAWGLAYEFVFLYKDMYTYPTTVQSDVRNRTTSWLRVDFATN